MEDLIGRRSWVIKELIRITEEMIQQAADKKEELLESNIRKRAHLFCELSDLSTPSIDLQQQDLWMRQLSYLQKKDEDLRSLVEIYTKEIRSELTKSKKAKAEIIGNLNHKGHHITSTA